MSVIRTKSNWLLFFSVPKLLHFQSLLHDIHLDCDLDLDAIVREVTFLFENDAEFVHKKLKPAIQVCTSIMSNERKCTYLFIIECNQENTEESSRGQLTYRYAATGRVPSGGL